MTELLQQKELSITALLGLMCWRSQWERGMPFRPATARLWSQLIWSAAGALHALLGKVRFNSGLLAGFPVLSALLVSGLGILISLQAVYAR